MSRKSLWFGLGLAAVVAMLVFTSADAKPKKKKHIDRVSGPPTLSLAADSSMIKACNDELARVRLVATARSADGASLRYRWTTSGGRLRGDGANTNWDLAGARQVRQAVPGEVVCVAESGVRSPDDVTRLINEGADAVLIPGPR